MRRLAFPAVLLVLAASCGGRTSTLGPTTDAGRDAPAEGGCTGTEETCNGLDDDCDGVADGPEADVWCEGRLTGTERAICRGGACVADRCFLGFADCDGNPENGCETPLDTETNCAGCGDSCDRPFATTQCSRGSCLVTSCALGRGNCNQDDRDGCEQFLAPRYDDDDGDGFGVGMATFRCPNEPGTSQIAGDCYDGNGDARPGQTAFFATHRGDLSFDYDCDGLETQELPNAAGNFCVCGNNGCSISEGWQGQVPACGATGPFRQKNTMQPFNCSAVVTTRTQRCR